MSAAPRAVPRRRLCAGLLALLPILGADQVAEQAVREGNALYASGNYQAALDRYRAAAEVLPESAAVRFNIGSALFKNQDQEQALDRYLAALTTEDPELAGRAKYNIGVIKYRQALAAAHRSEDALTLTQAAVRYFRESLALDRAQDDARYNLELAYRFQGQIEQQLRRDGENSDQPIMKASLRRGQAFSDQVRNEGGGQRRVQPDQNSSRSGQRANETPENFTPSQSDSQAPKTARMPMAMGGDLARELMAELKERLEAAEVWRQEQRRKQLQKAGEQMPW